MSYNEKVIDSDVIATQLTHTQTSSENSHLKADQTTEFTFTHMFIFLLVIDDAIVHIDIGGI